jgi:prolyl-tRNA synthetase
MANEIFNISKQDFSEWYNNILKISDLIDQRYNVKGFIIYRPWLMRMIKQIYNLWEAELERNHHEPCLFPVVIPTENFEKESEHVKGFTPEVFWVTQGGNEKIEKLALRPTSETAFYQMYSLWIRSYADLPTKLYQSCSVYRYETKATKPLIRGREFLWIEAHDAFRTEAEALRQVEEDMEMTKRVYEKLAIPFIFFRRPKWDKFAGAVDTYAADSLLPDGKILQLPSTHYLGQHFSKAFDIMFEDENGNKQNVYQTCYGPPISRTCAALVAIHGDQKGLILPFAMAPVQVIIVPIIFDDSKEKVLNACHRIKESLKNFRVEIDETEKRPGEKFYYWEMKGVPLRIEVGPKDVDKDQAIIVSRVDGKKIPTIMRDIPMTVDTLGKSMLGCLKKKSDEYFDSMVSEAKTVEGVKRLIEERGGFAKFEFCSTETGEKCADELKEKTGADIRGTRLDERQKPIGNCIVCGKKAGVIAYAGKSY